MSTSNHLSPLHRNWHLSLQEVGHKVPTSSPPSARLPGLCRLHLHFLLPALLLPLLQHLRFSLPSLPVPLRLLGAPAHLLRSGGPSGRGRGGPARWQNAPQAQAEPQFAAQSHRRPQEGARLQLGAAAAGSVWQQRVYGVKLRHEGRCLLPASEQDGRTVTHRSMLVMPIPPSSSGPKLAAVGDRRLLGRVAPVVQITDGMKQAATVLALVSQCCFTPAGTPGVCLKRESRSKARVATATVPNRSVPRLYSLACGQKKCSHTH